jgi:glycosyltransferase involved in cell wall biosynthesis
VFTEYAMSIGSRVKPLFWKVVQRPSLAAVNCFHATAQSEYEDIRRMGFRQPVCLIPNGIDIPAHGAGFDLPERTLLFLGRAHPNKGLDTLIRAWNKVSGQLPAWKLRIVGDSSDNYLDEMKQLAASLAAPKVEFTGALYGANKFQAYREAEAYILPSYSENFGVTVAEALAHGVPAIVTKGAPWSGLNEVGAGYWVDLTVDCLAAAILSMCVQDRPALQLMGARGKEWMVTEYSWHSVAKQMAEVYEWLLGCGSLPDCVILD